MGLCSLGRALRVLLLFVALLAGVAPAPAFASAARARWLPTGDPRVAGYHVYVRNAGGPYGTPVDVGMPVAAADGTLSSVIDGLTASRIYHLAVAAYTGDGAESALSGELALGALNTCVIDSCASPTDCDFGTVPDGTWCTHDGDTDACTAIGACVAGKCTPSASGAGRLAATRVHVSVRRREGRLTVHGRFLARGGFDPKATGATLELANASGAKLYSATIPGTALDRIADLSADRTAFRYLGTRREARQYNGLRVLNLFVSADGVAVTARAESPDLRALLAERALRATVRLGDTCARDLDLTCRRFLTGGLSCR
jgi:hypothetical protein